jgi:hypothetical protein
MAYWGLLIVGSAAGSLMTILPLGLYEHVVGVPKKDSWDDKSVAIIACTTFFWTLSTVFTHGYQKLGLTEESEEAAKDRALRARVLQWVAVVLVIVAWISPGA